MSEKLQIFLVVYCFIATGLLFYACALFYTARKEMEGFKKQWDEKRAYFEKRIQAELSGKTVSEIIYLLNSDSLPPGKS